MKTYIVCDACYMLNDESYNKFMAIIFPEGQNIMINSFRNYGGEIVMTSEFNDRLVSFIQYMSTKGGDCSIDGLGCDAGNFSLFEMDCDEAMLEQFSDSPHMFRIFTSVRAAMSFQEKIISLS